MSHESEGEEFEIPPFTVMVHQGLREWVARAYHEDGRTTLETRGKTRERAKWALLEKIAQWARETNNDV